MAGNNIVDFEEFMEQKFDREAKIDLQIERATLIDFIQQSDRHMYYVKLALATYPSTPHSHRHSTAISGSNWPENFGPT